MLGICILGYSEIQIGYIIMVIRSRADIIMLICNYCDNIILKAFCFELSSKLTLFDFYLHIMKGMKCVRPKFWPVALGTVFK